MLNKVGVIYNQSIPAARQLGEQVSNLLHRYITRNWLAPLSEDQNITDNIEGTDIIFTVGGDGTILRTARSASPQNIPIVGINLGKVGFLTEINATDAIEKLPLFLESKTWIDERSMLQAELITNKNKQKKNEHLFALNDIVIGRGEIPRLIHITVSIDGTLLTTYKTDGVIASTATGSTAYSLANKGPIIYPQSRDILLIPISPYLCMNHPLILPSTSIIDFQIQPSYEGILSIDGQINISLQANDIVKIKRSSYVTRLMRICSPHSFYNLLEKKLKEK